MICRAERDLLRDLGRRLAELAARESNHARIEQWTRLNALDPHVAPLVLTHLWPRVWNEVLPDSELRCSDETARAYERSLRRRIWSAETLDDDGVVEPVAHYPQTAWLDAYDGLQVQKRWAGEEEEGAAEFVPVIVRKTDIDKLGDPVLHVDPDAAERVRDEALEVFSSVLTVVKSPYTFAAKVADEFSWLRGLANTYTDLVEDPTWVHEALQRIADNFRKRFTLAEDAGVWGVAEKSDPLGSAGLRFAPGLSDWRSVPDPAAFAPKLSESWGFTCHEVFTCASPAMHDEFGFAYDRQLMGLFRYINVGCCETLDAKAPLIRSLPNARKVSVSEWCDVRRAAEAIGPGYVYSYRAAGVPFVQEPWDREAVRREIGAVLDATRGLPVEIVLNIGGTLGPGDAARKLVEWNRLAGAMVRER